MKIIHTLPFIPKMEKYYAWKNYVGKNYGDRTPFSYIRGESYSDDTIFFSQFLFPSFIMKGGGVFLAFLYSEEKFNKLRKGVKLSEVEETINHLPLKDFFCGCKNLDMDLLNELAEMLAFSWRLSLKEKFPDKEFTVRVAKEEDSSPMISFSQYTFYDMSVPSKVREERMKIIHTLPFIPEMEKYQSWREHVGNEGSDSKPLTYLRDEFDYEETILFSHFLFPTFVERDGGVFLAFQYSDKWFEKLRKDDSIHKVEELINQIWFSDMFCSSRHYALEELAEIMAFSWRLSLKEKFPDKKFTIVLRKGYAYSSPIVTFFQAGRREYESIMTE